MPVHCKGCERKSTLRLRPFRRHMIITARAARQEQRKGADLPLHQSERPPRGREGCSAAWRRVLVLNVVQTISRGVRHETYEMLSGNSIAHLPSNALGSDAGLRHAVSAEGERTAARSMTTESCERCWRRRMAAQNGRRPSADHVAAAKPHARTG